MPMVWVYGHYKYFYSYSSGIDFRRRQILTTEGDPHAVKVNPYPARLFKLNFHPLEVVPHLRNPQLQVGEKLSYFFN